MERILYNNNSFDAVNMKLTVNDLVEVEKERIIDIWNVSGIAAFVYCFYVCWVENVREIGRKTKIK